MTVRTGLERLLDGEGPDLRDARLGLVMHPASVTMSLAPADRALQDRGIRPAALFGPQHGARGEKQDNMIESESYTDDAGLAVYSLYGEVRKPTPEMLEGLDVLLCDLQDVGVRVYTFSWTMALAMEACRDANVRVVVLDRPNPIGGEVREGAVLREGFQSFVGLHRIPLRHGLTLGEMAKVVNEEFGIGCELEVVPCEGWRRTEWFDETGLPFVFPSPNIPTLDTCAVYPGMVLMEGTNLSEGRGTTRPFELFGAPFLDPDRLVRALDRFELPGVTFRPCYFEPTFQKHRGQLCGGAQIHVTDRAVFRSVATAIAILRACKKVAPDDFAWHEPPYEYEFERMPIDVLWGSDALRKGIDAGQGVGEVLEDVPAELDGFERLVSPHLIYR